jgi:saccharopine dehydrogenase-like NADP-dependent oxidoreductase
MGREAVATLLSDARVEEVVVADVDLQTAQAFVASLGDHRARATRVDLLDHDSSVRLFADHDLIMNTAGPFFTLGVPAIRAAIAARRNYVDICDDYRPTIDALSFDAEARTAGIIVLVGMGGSPGISNLLAVKACRELDSVDHLQTAWGLVGGVVKRRPNPYRRVEDIKPRAALVHFLYSVAGTVPVWRNGQLVQARPVVEAEVVEFPQGQGTFRLIGHPEPVTLPRFLPNVHSCVNLFGGTRETYALLIKWGEKLRSGEVSPTEAAANYVWDRAVMVEARPATEDLGPPLCGTFYASARGRVDGVAKIIGYGTGADPGRGMAGMTGVPLAIAAGMIIRGEIDVVGVLAPEACIDPDAFFERYASFCNLDVDGVLYRYERTLPSSGGQPSAASGPPSIMAG